MRSFMDWLAGTPLSIGIQSVAWLIPFIQSIHILMIAIVFVSILMIALRVLGVVGADQPFADVWRRFAPWMWSGLAVMAGTGLILIIAEPAREFYATSFRIKMALILVGIVGALGFRQVLLPAAAAAGREGAAAAEFSYAAKAAAAATVVLWLFIIFLGRAIAYDVEVWGPLSTAPRL